MPDKTLDYFTKISQIPRPSGMEAGMRNFLTAFANEHDLECTFDKTCNVIIKKPSNKKDCNKTLILQVHTDMVCEKNGDVDFDFLTEAIKLKTEGDFLMAEGTTLGADNGIGLSMILSILDDDNLEIPNLECIFTAQEETTMQGAIDLDFSKIKGSSLLSIDGTDEAKIEVSSAGMKVIKYTRKFATSPLSNKEAFKLSLSGLCGGHSGAEIHTNRKNSIKLLFDLLKTFKGVNIISVSGGGKSNAIPRECACVFSCDKSFSELQLLAKNFSLMYKDIEPDFLVKVESVELDQDTTYINDSNDLVEFITSHKNGVLEYDSENTSFPLVSNNLANINLTEGTIDIIISLRSSVTKLETQYLEEINKNAESFGFSYEVLSSAPFFERQKDSYLQNLCKTTYESLYDKTCVITGVHAGLEGGVFASKKKGLDICVIAPNIYDAHSPKERVSLSSIFRVYKWLEKILKEF